METELLKNITKVLLVPAILFGCLPACGYDNHNDVRTNINNRTHTYSYDTNHYDISRHYANDYNTAARINAFGFNQRVAQRVEDLVEDVPGVRKTTAIVYGNDIIVGIDETNQKNIQGLVSKVNRVVTIAEPSYKVHVTADDKIHTKIRSVYMNSTSSHPVEEDIGAQITDIIHNIDSTLTSSSR